MSQVQKTGGGKNQEDPFDATDIVAGQTHITNTGVDDLLDEIDGLLETNAEEFVRSYVQKGGQ